MRMVTKVYTMNKVLISNERATSKRDLEWMGGEEKEWVLLGWRFLERHHARDTVKKLGFNYILWHRSSNMFLPIFGFQSRTLNKHVCYLQWRVYIWKGDCLVIS